MPTTTDEKLGPDLFATIEKYDRNGKYYTLTLIGTISVPPNIVREESQQVAAWRRSIALTPGTYPAFYHERYADTRVVATIDGTIVEAYTPALFAGSPIRDPHRAERDADERGRPRSYDIDVSPYTFAEEVIRPSASPLAFALINPNFEIVTRAIESFGTRRLFSSLRRREVAA